MSWSSTRFLQWIAEKNPFDFYQGEKECSHINEPEYSVFSYILEVKIIIEMRKAFNGLIGSLHVAEKRISEREDTSLEISKTEMK